MALVAIGQMAPTGAKKPLRLGLVKNLGGEVRSSFQRIGSSVGEKVTSTAQTGLQRVETGVRTALQSVDPFAAPQPEGAPVESAEPAESPEDPIAAGYDQLSGLADLAGILAEGGRAAEARALIGALDTILKITKTSTMEVQQNRSPVAPPAPPAVVTPVDEGSLLASEGVGQVYGGDSNADNRFPGTLNPPASTEPIFARPNGPKRVGPRPAFGPEAGLLVLPRRAPARAPVEIIPDVMRRPGGGIIQLHPRRVPPFSWRNRY